MFAHHAQTVQNVTKHFQQDPSVLAVLLSGSIAHGFESADSDVDILILVDEEEYARRQQTGELTFFSREPLCTYEGGYVDGKFLSLSFLRQVGERGSEPARFAFEGVRVLFTRHPAFAVELDEALRRAVAYPLADKSARLVRFRGQLEVWNWYCDEARKKDNEYLLRLAAQKVVLFGGRLILAHNEVLYPYHKWFLRVLEGPAVAEKPEGLIDAARRVTADPCEQNVKAFYDMVRDFQPWPGNPNGWGAQFLVDSELSWMHGNTPVDDL